MALTQQEFDEQIVARLTQVRLADGIGQDLLNEIKEVRDRGDPANMYNAEETLDHLGMHFKDPFNDKLQAWKDAVDAIAVVL